MMLDPFSISIVPLAGNTFENLYLLRFEKRKLCALRPGHFGASRGKAVNLPKPKNSDEDHLY